MKNYSLSKVARFLGVSRPFLRKAIDNQKLKADRSDDNLWLISQKEAERFKRKMERKGKHHIIPRKNSTSI